MSAANSVQTIDTQCCIAGGGPAGMMLGFLLARAGVDVVVLEKHGDFLRDFRGDTIHPSTLEILFELGLLDDFLQRPHQEVQELAGKIGDTEVVVADFRHLPTHCRFVAFMPQWDFLNFLAEYAKRYPSFRLELNSEVIELLEADDRVVGVRAMTPNGELQVRADLVVGADGRQSIVRKRAGLEIVDLGAPIDVLWMRLSRQPNDPGHTLGRFDRGRIFIMINRDEYWQCGFVIPKGGIERIRQAGLPTFREKLVEIAPFIANRVDELRDWDDVKLLTVCVDRLGKWHRPGLLCIGDAAHAMSPVGGVGINLAIQDAVAAANILAAPLQKGRLTADQLAKVQRRRQFPTRVTQGIQVFIQNRVISRVLESRTKLSPPWPVKLLGRWPLLRRIPARVIGLGIRPEHVRTPKVNSVRHVTAY